MTKRDPKLSWQPAKYINALQADVANYVLSLANAKRHLDIPTYDGSGQMTHPKVLYMPDYGTSYINGWNGYKYWMTMSPYPQSNDDYENPSIVASNDGINWVVPAGMVNPIQVHPNVAGGDHFNDPHLVFVAGILECWWGGTTGAFRSWSSDGVTWSTPVLMANGSQYSQAVMYNGKGEYELFYIYGETYATEIYRKYGTVPATNAVLTPGMNVDTNGDGCPDNWTIAESANVTTTKTINADGAKWNITASTGAAVVFWYQDVNVSDGDYKLLSVDMNAVRNVGSFVGRIRVDLMTAAQVNLGTIFNTDFITNGWETKEFGLKISGSTAHHIRIYLEAQVVNAGDTGSVAFRNCKVQTNLPTWGVATLIPSTFEDGYKPWHMDIIKTDLGYESVVNAHPVGRFNNNEQALFHASSNLPTPSFSFVKILEASKDPTAWDSQMVYRACLLKSSDGLYKLWYSAFSKYPTGNGMWHIGLSTGYNIKQLQGYEPPAAGTVQNLTTTVTTAEIVAGKKLIGNTGASKKITVLRYFVKVVGDFSTGGGTSVIIQDNASTPVVVVTFAKAALTANAKISSNLTVANVTDGGGMLTPLTAGKDLVIPACAGISGGTSLIISIDYTIV